MKFHVVQTMSRVEGKGVRCFIDAGYMSSEAVSHMLLNVQLQTKGRVQNAIGFLDAIENSIEYQDGKTMIRMGENFTFEHTVRLSALLRDMFGELDERKPSSHTQDFGGSY